MEQETKIRKHIYFYGRVQGVGFRYYAVQKAEELGLNGWVRNLYDSSVEMEVEGEEADIDQLILFLQNRTCIWIEDMKVAEDGSVMVLMTQDRDDDSASELMVFRLTGF